VPHEGVLAPLSNQGRVRKGNMNRKKLLLTIPMILITFLAFFALLSTPVLAQEEADFDRVNEIAKQLNCPTCAGINLADCRTKTCEQWREQIGELVVDGYSDQEVLDYFSTRYGDQVLQEPPVRGFSLALWVLPVIALVVGGIWLAIILRRWRQPEPSPAAAGMAEIKPTEPVPDFSDGDDDYLQQVDQDLGIDEA
jgi:cytochrome c-type biogenesis protein CcmH